jgi:hypothetical protein
MTMALHVTSNDRAVENVNGANRVMVPWRASCCRAGPSFGGRAGWMQWRVWACRNEPIEVGLGAGKGGARAREHWMAHG